MEDEHSRSAASDSYEEDEDFVNDDAYDDEGTLAEEEALNGEGDADELTALQEEAEMSVEELQRRYCMPPPGTDEEIGEEETEDEEEEMEGEGAQGPSGSGPQHGAENGTAGPPHPHVLYGVCIDDEDDDEEKDKDYDPHLRWRREPRIDPVAYQAQVPSYDTNADVYEHASTTLWRPQETMDDDAVNAYIIDCMALRHNISDQSKIQGIESTAKIRDDEDCLWALFEANFDTRKAKEKYPFKPANLPRITVRQGVNTNWDENDCARFEEGLRNTNKNFFEIQRQYLPHRNVGELVEFYYTWKKTERYCIFRQNKGLIGKHGVNPHCTDFMEKVCEQMDERAGDSGKKWQAWEGDTAVAHGSSSVKVWQG